MPDITLDSDEIEDIKFEDAVFEIELNEDNQLTFEQLYREISEFSLINGHLNFSGERRLFNFENRVSFAIELANIAFEKKCVTNELKKIVFSLLLNEGRMRQESSQFVSKPDSFPKVYGFLIYQCEILTQILGNLINNNENNDGWQSQSGSQIFEFIFSMHSYLEVVCDLLILYHCYFNWNWNYVSIFHYLIQLSCGNIASKKIFADLMNDMNDMNDDSSQSEWEWEWSPAAAANAYAMADIDDIDTTLMQRLKNFQKKIDSAAKIGNILKKCIHDTHNHNGNQNPINFAIAVKMKINQIIGNIKSKNTVKLLTNQNVNLKKTKEEDVPTTNKHLCLNNANKYPYRAICTPFMEGYCDDSVNRTKLRAIFGGQWNNETLLTELECKSGNVKWIQNRFKNSNLENIGIKNGMNALTFQINHFKHGNVIIVIHCDNFGVHKYGVFNCDRDEWLSVGNSRIYFDTFQGRALLTKESLVLLFSDSVFKYRAYVSE